MTADPGYSDPRNRRAPLRALGVGLAVCGVLLLGYGLFRFVSGIFGESIADDQMEQAFVSVLVGGLALMTGILLLSLGRSTGDLATAVPGRTDPLCDRCGARSDESARYCNSCGTALA